ncbi:MAG: alpha/beta hydrolase [Flavobacteriales bacterium]|jgi:phospholipase/carboxylesterase|nr:phospholipase [Flavobacteriaceae bacterium]MDO7580985.1 phospholipase [Flavobacteriaceae bacterium]MDO7592185.1 phospholipase [Flavobacteriaceae bacterium]MDO7598492.1 phospholipase [Flavobacteriaceae bacterium]MDO7602471.1 phospholipase [Flavobacteriaceae bacterium]|tara:strand:+ start:599 stop:1258 length:660 start_codon:yes stop_codon:yes gene_type:complete
MNIDSNQILEYLHQAPIETSENSPILFLIHGYGSYEGDLFSFAQYLPKNYHIIALRAPIVLAEGSYAWYTITFDEDMNKWSNDEEGIQSRDLIISNIEHHLKRLNSSKKNVDLLGFSQGAILSWSLGMSYPKSINRIMALSGFYNPKLDQESSESKADLKCFSSHGIIDPVIPVAHTRIGINNLREKGVSVAYKEYDAPHTISPDNFRDLLQWLQSKEA